MLINEQTRNSGSLSRYVKGSGEFSQNTHVPSGGSPAQDLETASTLVFISLQGVCVLQRIGASWGGARAAVLLGLQALDMALALVLNTTQVVSVPKRTVHP